MRITGDIMIDNMMKHLQENMSDLDELNQKLSSGKQFQYPSEAPIKVANSMQFNSLIKNSEQYKRNVNQSRNWLSHSEDALSDTSKILHRARELAIRGRNDSLSSGDREKMVQEVSELRDELVNIGNSKLGDRYLFAGQATATKPLDEMGNYNGDKNSIEKEINPAIKMKINVDGEKAFSNAIQALNSLEQNLQPAGNPEDIAGDIGELETALDNNASIRAEFGAKLNRLDLVEGRLDDEVLNLKKLKSENEDVELAEVITDLKMEESVYRASLASGARIMQPTLVDFLR